MRGKVASVATGSVTATPGPAAPASPADFSATSGDGSAILSWTAAADNGSPITKYQYQQDSGAWTDIDASATSFTVTGLTNDVEYTFKLRAVNNIGEGAESDAVSATPIALPVAPINLMITKITVFSSTVTLGWSNPGNSSITGYQVRQSHSVDSAGDRVWGIWESFSSSAHTESTNVRVSHGIEYAFQIRAVNAAGAGAGAASDTVTAALPSAKPANFAATEGDGQVKLSWTNPNDGTITGYEVQQSTDGGTTWDPDWTAITGSTGTTVEHTVTGLTNGTTYTFQIRAMQGTVEGVASDSVNATPSGKGSPLVPTGFSATSGDESANLSWTAADDNGSPITRYQYQQDGGDWTDIPASAPGGSNAVSFTVTGLTNGNTYAFKLRAVNNRGNGAETGEASATPVAAQTTEINLWTATLTVGKHKDNNWYGLGGNTDGTRYGSITPDSFTHDDTTYDIEDLIFGAGQLFFQVSNPIGFRSIVTLTVGGRDFAGSLASTGSGGRSLAWHPDPGFTWAVGEVVAVSLNLNVITPDAPAGFSATAGPGKVDLAWADPNDVTITKYQYRQKAGTGSFSTWNDISGSAASTTSHTVIGLTVGTPYTFQVRAVNAAGPGAVSEAAPVTPDAAAPGAPQNFRVGGGDEQALLFWSAAADNGSPITKYQYQQKEGAGDFGARTDIPDSAPGGANAVSFTVENLTNGTEYAFKLLAENSIGVGAESEERTATPAGAPLAPTGFSATRGDESAILSWTAADNNGAPIIGYQYQQDGGNWTDIAGSDATTVEHTVTGLTNGNTYTFKLRAVSGLGNGAETGQASATPAAAQAAEINLWSATLTVGKHSVLANEWYGFGKNPDDTTYGKIAPDSFTLGDTTYSVVSLISTQSTIDTLFFRVSNPVSFRNVMTLTVGGTTFRGSVVSNPSHGNSGMTWTADPGLTWAVGDTVAVSLKATPPDAPANFSATAGPLRAELAWTNPDDANITKYQYRQKEGAGDFGAWTDITGSGATTTFNTVTGLTGGAAYTFQLRAVNAAGPGAVSE